MRLFISYAHVDHWTVKNWIASPLQAAGHTVWFDDQLIAGQDWQQQLRAAIRRCDALVYAMTPEAVASEWCQWELAEAVARGKPVIPVLMQANTPLPDSLAHLQYVDFSDGPTGDAVARLLGGVQQLSPAQLPPAPARPQGKPPQAMAGQASAPQPGERHPVLKRLGDILGNSTTQGVLALLGLVITVLLALPGLTGSPAATDAPTQIAAETSLPTPRTPVFEPLRDLDIRTGPGNAYERVDILVSGGAVDVLGVSEDRLWYLVLLRSGGTGWILAAESGGRVFGDRGVIQVVRPTATVTATATVTPTTPPPTQTPSPTPTTPAPIAASATPSVATPTTETAGSAPQGAAYPCPAQIDPTATATRLNIARAVPNQNAAITGDVRRGQNVIVLGRSAGAEAWYEIATEAYVTIGWVPGEYVVLSPSCPVE